MGVDTVYVISVKDYNNQYSQNDTLNNIILVNYFTYRADDINKFFPFENYIQANEAGILRDELEIKIKEPPFVQNDFASKVVLILKNGETFEATSSDIRLI